MADSPKRPLATPDEVAAYLGVTRQKLAQMRYLGTGPAFTKPSDRVVRYAWDDVDHWLEGRKFTQTGATPVLASA